MLPRFLFDIQKVYPVSALVLFSILNAMICLCSNTLTALLFSPSVANAWRRAAARPQVPKKDTKEE